MIIAFAALFADIPIAFTWLVSLRRALYMRVVLAEERAFERSVMNSYWSEYVCDME
jgi:hypothetical protein